MQIVYRVEAAKDVGEARTWYEQQAPGLGRAFQDALRRAEDLLRKHPAAFPMAHEGYRRLLLRHFPYAVYYQTVGDERLEVIAVLHQRQDADALRDRE